MVNVDGNAGINDPVMDGGEIPDVPSALVESGPLQTDWWDYIVQDSLQVVSGTTNEVEIEDVVFNETTDPIYYNNKLIQITTKGDVGDIEFESSDTDVAVAHNTGLVEYQDNGPVDIAITSAVRNATLHFDMYETGGSTTHTYVRDAVESLRKHICDSIDDCLVGYDNTDLDIFSTQNHTTQTYVRNSGNPFNTIDFTCCSPWNSANGAQRAGTLISPLHVVFATHYQIAIGAVLRFIDNDGVIYYRTLVARFQVGATDLVIGVLDSPLPAAIKPAKVLPLDWSDYLPKSSVYPFSSGYGYRIPIICVDQQEKTFVNEIYDLNTNGTVACTANTIDSRKSFTKVLVPGDSGNPGFFIINGELVIVCTWYYSIGGPGLHNYISEINTIMTNNGGYQLTHPNLVAFAGY